MQDNELVLSQLRRGPRDTISRYVTNLFHELTASALRLTQYSEATGFITKIQNPSLLTLIEHYPDETIPELQRVFHGFRLSVEKDSNWILHWGPPCAENKERSSERVLVDFPSEPLGEPLRSGVRSFQAFIS